MIKELIPCTFEELVERAKRSRMVDEAYELPVGINIHDYPSTAEAISDDLRLNEDQMFALLGLEYSIPSMPQELLAEMEVFDEFRMESAMTVFRREGFCPVEQSRNGVYLVVVCYPFTHNTFIAVDSVVGVDVEFVLGSDRTLASIFSRSVMDNETSFEVADTDEGIYLGSDDEETMFPGLYGGGSSELLYEEPQETKADSSAATHKTKGFVEDLGFLDMLQMMSQSRKTGSLFINNQDKGEIYIFFDEGNIVHCITEFENGEEGFYRIIGITDGEFEISMGPVDVEQTINAPTNALLMEGLRRLDESQAGEGQNPQHIDPFA